jgi:hypothetical protein
MTLTDAVSSLFSPPQFVIEIRRIRRPGDEETTRVFPFASRDIALAAFETLVRLGGRAYASGRYRAVLKSTDTGRAFTAGAAQ